MILYAVLIIYHKYLKIQNNEKLWLQNLKISPVKIG